MKELLGKGISYNPFKTSDKHYFGSFFNLAFNNINEAFSEVSQRLSSKRFSPKDFIQNYTRNNISLSDYERFVKLISDYFPIFEEVDQTHEIITNKIKTRNERIEDFKNIALKLIDSVESLRNFYTHYDNRTICIDEKLFSFLDRKLFTTVLITKKKYLKDNKTREMISDSLKRELEVLYTKKVDQLRKKEKENKEKREQQKRKGNKQDRRFQFSTDEIEIHNSIFNDAINEFIYDKNQKPDISNRRKTSFNKNEPFLKGNELDFNLPISSSGIIFLLSCFLNRKEIEDLKANIKGYKGKGINPENSELKHNGIRFMTTHKIYSYWHYKGLKNKIKTSESDTKETLLMQMADELSKVPDAIYQNLSEDIQKSFVEDANSSFEDDKIYGNKIEEIKIVRKVTRKRYEDKFNYFAIRFLDEFVDFPSLRFQIHLGNYIKDKRTKQISNVETERAIKDKIYVFGKLSDVNKYKYEFFQKIEENKQETNWEIFPNPSYHFPHEHSEELKKANKIGIYLKGINDKKEQFVNKKDKSASKRKLSLIDKICKHNQDIYSGQPAAYLSMNDIHSIIYEALNEKEKSKTKIDGKKIEDKIRKQINEQITELLSQKETGSAVKNKNKKTELENIEDLIENEIKITKQKIEDLKQKRQEYILFQKHKNNRKNDKTIVKRHHILYNSEKGEIATWLANDIKRFFPREFKDNWRGHHHSEFQLNIAFYDTQKSNIKQQLRGINLRKEIPMIDFRKSRFLDFYLTYLLNRYNYFIKIQFKLSYNPNDNFLKSSRFKKCLKIFKKRNYTNSKLKDKIESALANPIFLARGFMEDKPTFIKNSTFLGNEENYADWFVAFKKHQDYQEFYDIEKYPLEISPDDKSELRKVNTKIYTQKKNDWISWMILNHLFKGLFNQEISDLSLSEIFQDKTERDINKQKALEGLINQNFFWNKTIDLNLNEKIIIENVKLKDVGNYRKYEKDQRVITFLSYDDIDKWEAYLPNDWNVNSSKKPINIIDVQLDAYEKIRQHDMLKEVQDLEKFIFDQIADKKILNQNSYPNFKKYIVNGLLEKILDAPFDKNNIPNSEKEFNTITVNQLKSMTKIERSATLLIVIRNKFAHNQLPNSDVYLFLQKVEKRDNRQTYAAFYLQHFKRIIKYLKNYSHG